MFYNLKQQFIRWYAALLVARFGLLIFDPRLYQPLDSTAREGLQGFYNGAEGLVDLIYVLTNPLLILLNWFANILLILIPALDSDWFPAMPAGVVERWVEQQFGFYLGLANQVDIMMGVMDWLVLPAIGFLFLLSPLLDKWYENIKNLVWHFIIENSFTQKKQAIYQEALLKRSRDLMKLNADYKNLSQEASILKDSVNMDGLTRVFNKRFFQERMAEVFKQAKENKRKLGLLMLDIDHFKKLNDTYGHLVGDDVLRDVASVVKEACPTNGYVCRFGGEEFALILPDLPLEAVEDVADGVKVGLDKLKFEVDSTLKVSVSQGLVYLDFSKPFAKALDEMDDFIKFADDELYRAKLEGRARICVNQLG